MTAEEANQINLESESNPILLRKLVKFWQEKALISEYQLMLYQGKLTESQINETLNIEKIKQLFK
jgi:hypothetical protein